MGCTEEAIPNLPFTNIHTNEHHHAQKCQAAPEMTTGRKQG